MVISILLMTCLLVQPGDVPDRAPPEVIVVSMTKGFRHQTIPLGIETLQALARESGAFRISSVDDFDRFTDDGLRNVGAIVFLSTTGELPMSEPQRAAMLRYIEQGGGFVGIHSATDTFYGWAEYGDMIGAYFDGHPWNAGDTVTLKIDDPDHPAGKPWVDAELTFKEEIYQFRRPYDRERLHVLLSLNVEKTDMSKRGIKRRDGDFALAWTKPHGQGRIFYTALGHNASVWKMPAFRAHLQAGLQQVLKR